MLGSQDQRILIALGIIGLFGIITFALAAATLGTVNKRLNVIENKLSSPTITMTTTTSPTITMTTTTSPTITVTTTTPPSINSTLAMSINIDEIAGYLGGLQNIANESNARG